MQQVSYAGVKQMPSYGNAEAVGSPDGGVVADTASLQ